MPKCIGCGVQLQNSCEEQIGYIKSLDKKICERCFRIKNYNEYKTVVKENSEFLNILEKIASTNDLVLLVVDLFNINKNLNIIGKYIKGNILLVLTKRDILPKSCYDKKIIEYFNNYNLNIKDTIIISSKNNYNYDLLFDKINKLKTSNKVYVVGFTNAGKSTMINKILYNYSDLKTTVTTSNLPTTTIDSINIKVNDNLTIIDTPGILDDGDIINYLTPEEIKKYIPNKEIKPITYQIKGKQSLIINDLVRVDVEDINSLTFYMSNNLEIKRVFKDSDELKQLKRHKLKISADSDIVIQGIMFIHIIKETELTLYTRDKVNVYIRKSLM